MIITASITLEHKQLETVLSENSKLGSLKAIANHEYGIELEWVSDSSIRIQGKMSAITLLAEEWQPATLSLESFTEDDEL